MAISREAVDSYNAFMDALPPHAKYAMEAGLTPRMTRAELDTALRAMRSTQRDA